jgi:hypothetical protein
MDDTEFRCFLDLLMVSDPWPLEESCQSILLDLADRQAAVRGYDNWVEAYHKFEE